MPINTDGFSAALRKRTIDRESRRLLITNFRNTKQASDLTEPANCAGYGRVRHFRMNAGVKWPKNPLPIEPARQFLHLPPIDELTAQVFQSAACNWRCWYCFVDFTLLSADPARSSYLTVSELIDLYLNEQERPLVIDLSGGQPDLIPEWIPWMMMELRNKGLDRSVYLWSDDNLSTDYFWRYLSPEEHELIASYDGYGKVCCFKGFDHTSFAFNTQAAPELFDRQFALVQRLLTLGVDLYFYVTLTTPQNAGIESAIASFIDRLQRLDTYLPLRTVPLEVRAFTPTKARLNPVASSALGNQHQAVEAWMSELARRYSQGDLAKSITDVKLAGRR